MCTSLYFITCIGTTLIVVGAVLVAGFAVVPEPNHDLQDLIQLYKRPAFIVYFTMVETLICVGLFLTHWIQYGLDRPNARPAAFAHLYRKSDLKAWLGIRYKKKEGRHLTTS